jgi:hypothetical protein
MILVFSAPSARPTAILLVDSFNATLNWYLTLIFYVIEYIVFFLRLCACEVLISAELSKVNIFAVVI